MLGQRIRALGSLVTPGRERARGDRNKLNAWSPRLLLTTVSALYMRFLAKILPVGRASLLRCCESLRYVPKVPCDERC